MRSVKKGQTKPKPYDEAILQRINKAASVPSKDFKLNLDSLLGMLAIEDNLKKVFEMYTYFRDHQPEETDNFQNLHNILTNPLLDERWGNILRRDSIPKSKHRFKAFRHVPVYKNHRLNNQPEDEADLRHPFFVLAGAYYHYRSTKRYPLFAAGNHAICDKYRKKLNKALKTFEKGFSRFKPSDEIEVVCQTIILKEIGDLKKLGDLNNPNNREAVDTAFNNIQEQVALLRDIHDRELETGMQYGCVRCYLAAQYLDLQLVSLHINMKTDLSTPDVTKLFCRIEKRANVVEQEHYMVGALLACKSYLKMTEAIAAAAMRVHALGAFVKTSIPSCKLFAISKSCGFSADNPASVKSLILQLPQSDYQKKQAEYFNKACSLLDKAKDLKAKGNDIALVHNLTGGRALSNLGLDFESLEKDIDNLQRSNATKTAEAINPSAA